MTTEIRQQNLYQAWLDTPLGPMFVVSNEEALYLLEFVDRRGLERQLEKLELKTKAVIIPGMTDPIKSVEAELKAYFEGTLTEFKTPLCLLGSPFQQAVWHALMHIPYGTTRTYLAQAKCIGKPTACRAVANANGANQLAIIIPCHRIINTNGEFGGYGAGVARKRWFIDHEKRIKDRKA
jgi:AraC family transcriptional regulator, regulatory protein of adaptative response / methylated-DNA-[protein]-cysteine methyltransferase